MTSRDRRPPGFFPAFWTVLACLAGAGPAAASARLFPVQQGSDTTGEALPTRLVKVDAEVFHGLARVKVEYRFDNTLEEQLEGLLRTRVPQGAVVTDFAYYYKGARIAGRLLENEKAEAIYRAITSRNRDPALFRRKAHGIYEARLFPIEPKTELRVELEYCYQVPEATGRLKFYYPMSAGLGKQPIGKVEVRVRFQGDPLEKVETTAGLAEVTARDEARMEWTAEDLTPNRDLLVTAALDRSAPPREAIHGGTAGGESFTALRFRGAHPAPPAGFLPGPRLNGSTTRYTFARRRSAAGVDAGKFPLASFWAQAQVQALLAADPKPRSPRTRARIVALSHRYRIDTKLTSYLAVPESEWAAYETTIEEQKREGVERFVRLADWEYRVLQLPAWAVPGDPVVRVPDRPGLERVLLILPDGDVLPLRLDLVTRVWEARFDIPEGAAEGDYRVTLVLLDHGGRRQELPLTYHVDLSPPSGTVETSGSRLRVAASPDTERAVAFLEDGTRINLTRMGDRFEAPLPALPRPVRIRLYDRVHNWVELVSE